MGNRTSRMKFLGIGTNFHDVEMVLVMEFELGPSKNFLFLSYLLHKLYISNLDPKK